MRAKNSLYTENRYQHTVYEENNVENDENCLLSSSSGHSSRWMSPPSSTLILLVSMMTVVVSHISLSPLFLPSSERKEYDHNNSHAKFIILHLELKQCYTQEYLTELCFFLTLSTKDKHKVVSSVLTVAALRIAIIQYVKDNEHRIP